MVMRSDKNATHSIEDQERSLSAFQSALKSPSSPAIDRIDCIAGGIVVLSICAWNSDWGQAYKAAEAAVHLIPKLTSRSLENSDRLHILNQVVRAILEANHESCVDVAKGKYEGIGDDAMPDESVRRGLHNVIRKLPDGWLGASTRVDSRGRTVSGRTEPRSASKGDERDGGLPRDVDFCDGEETGSLHWVPYVHFGV
ncbi:hypothetical protein F4802DRAFT_220169 [Xylaria palmicola]|nr:hypothetical protein F4802DRAFT_220169 [Xylaria palmicola]